MLAQMFTVKPDRRHSGEGTERGHTQGTPPEKSFLHPKPTFHSSMSPKSFSGQSLPELAVSRIVSPSQTQAMCVIHH